MTDYPSLKAEISFTATPSQPDSWQNVTDWVLEEGTSIQRGRSDEFESMRAGTATVTLYNNDRRFDPDYASSPYYPNVRPMQRIRLSAVWNGNTYPLFVGYIQSWRAGRPHFGMATTIVECVDGLGAAFAQQKIPDEVVLAEVPAPSTYYSVLSGTSFVGASARYPLTRLTLFRNPAITGGTFTITYNGNTTPTLNCSDLPAVWIAAIEALPGMGPRSVFVDIATSLVGNFGVQFYFAAQHVGVDISALLSASLAFTPSGGAGWYTQPPDFAYTPSVLDKPGGRSIFITIDNPVATAGAGYSVAVGGVLAGTNRIGTTNSNALYSAFPSRSITTQFTQIYWIGLGTNTGGAGTDAGKMVRIYLVSDPIASNLSGTMFFNASAYAGWRQEDVRYDAGYSTLLELGVSGSTGIQVLQKIADGEGGVTFVSKEGHLTFKDRASVVSGLSLATFGNPELDSDYLPFSDATPLYGERYIRNLVSVTAEGGDAQTVQDDTSIDRYYIRLLEENVIITTDAEALDRARYKLARYKEPQTRITNISHRGELDDDLWPILFGAELTNKYTVVYEPVSGVGIPKNVSLESISIRITRRDGWAFDWALSPSASVFRADISLASGPDIVIY